MTASLIQFLVSAVVIVLAGAALTQFGEIISNRTKLGGLLVGSILIAGATSLPELAIDISAVRIGSADLAAGDLLGSSIFNLLILAVLDLTRYSHGRMLSRESAGHALSGTVSIALTAAAGIFIFLGPVLEGVTIAGIGPGSLVLVAIYGLGIRLIYYGQKSGASQDSGGEETEAAIPRLRKLGLKGAIVGYIVAAAVILIAAPFLAKAAEDLAERSGLGGTFFGTTFVALCTSLPEVTTTFAAVRMKAFSMALGNIFGSNCFNMIIFVPLDIVHEGSLFAAVSQTHVYTALATIVITTVIILGQLYPVEKRKPFLEPDAWLAILLIVGALTGLYFIRE